MKKSLLVVRAKWKVSEFLYFIHFRLLNTKCIVNYFKLKHRRQDSQLCATLVPIFVEICYLPAGRYREKLCQRS